MTPQPRHKSRWTAYQIEYLRKNYASVNIDDLVRVIDKSRKSIYAKAKRLGLARTQEHRKRVGRENQRKRQMKDSE